MGTLGWIQDGEMVALGWTLLHFCWQGTAIAMVYALLDRVMVGAGAKVRYGISVVALCLMPIAALMTFAEEQRLLLHVQGNGHEVIASRIGVMHAGVLREIPAAAPIAANTGMWIAQHAEHLLPWIDMLWLGGVVLLALRAAGGWWQLERLRRRARAAVPLDVQASFRRVSERLHMAERSRCVSRMRRSLPNA